MKTKPHKINWHDSTIAATWPEGCTIMEAAFLRGKPVWNVCRISTWHRPDRLDISSPHYQKYLTQYKYALLSLPDKQKLKRNGKRSS